ncbi:MAG: hypothetical protein R2697_04440 [Ilumatobacteraceae bacterium]
MIATATFVPETMQAAADAETTAATDLAEYLVRAGVPFRDAHAIVGQHVRAALAGDGSLSELVAADDRLGADAAALVRPGVGVEMRSSPGAAPGRRRSTPSWRRTGRCSTANAPRSVSDGHPSPR